MEELQNKVKKLNALLEASKLLNSTQDVDYILDFLLKKSLELIKGGDTGVIFLFNKDTQMLEIRAFVGFDSNLTQIKLSPGESMTGITFLRQEPIFFSDTREIREAMSSMTEENKIIMEKSLKIKSKNLRGSICCPLMSKEKCIGVIVIDNFENHALLTREDISLLESISVQATIAIINAGNYERELKNNEALEKYNKMVEHERNKYRYSTSLHSKFTEMVLNGCNIEDILIKVSSLLQRDVFLIDLFYNINNYSFQYFIESDIVLQASNELCKHLKNNKRNQYFWSEKKVYFHFFPIIVNMDTLGWLSVVSNNNIYSELDNITVEKCITILALEILKTNTLSDMEQSLKGDFLDSLLYNQNREYIVKCARKYKLNFNCNHQMVIIDIEMDRNLLSQEKYEKELKRYIKYYYKFVNEKVNRTFPKAIVLIKGHSIILILEIRDNNNRRRIRYFLEDIMSMQSTTFFNRYGIKRLRAGVSDVIRSVDKFKISFENAKDAVRMTRNMEGENKYIFYDDLEVKKLLLNNDKEDLEAFLQKTLGPLLNYQSKSKDEFLETLKTYIMNNGNWTYTKDYLHIHGNTLSYRLNRIMKILKVDLNDYNQRFNIQVALEILDIIKTQGFESI